MKKSSVILLAAAAGTAALAILPLFHGIPPVPMTRSAIMETFVRIQLYALVHDEIPDSLDVLPERDRYANRTTDGWGRKLIYSVDSDGALSIGSLGRDGISGGSGDDADIEVRFRTRDEHGRFMLRDELWIVDAEIHKELQ